MQPPLQPSKSKSFIVAFWAKVGPMSRMIFSYHFPTIFHPFSYPSHTPKTPFPIWRTTLGVTDNAIFGRIWRGVGGRKTDGRWTMDDGRWTMEASPFRGRPLALGRRTQRQGKEETERKRQKGKREKLPRFDSLFVRFPLFSSIVPRPLLGPAGYPSGSRVAAVVPEKGRPPSFPWNGPEFSQTPQG